MWGILLLDAAIAILVVAGWYFGWREVNRRRGERVMRTVVQAMGGPARVSAPRWHGASHFDLELRFAAAFLESSLSVELTPREMPLHWWLAHARKQTEQVTFRAELEHQPPSNLIIANQHWYGRTSRTGAMPESCYSLRSLVITTREDWQGEAAIIERILAARSEELIQVEFRRKAPHVVVTAPLNSLTQSENDSGLFGLLQELATCMTAQKD
jgi:hypothetical protein